MTKEQVSARRDLIIAERAQTTQQIAKLTQERLPGWVEQVSEYERLRDTQFGVIQDCDHWLLVLAAEEETARLAAEKAGEWVDVSKKLLEMPGQLDEIVDRIAEREASEAVREAAAG